ncbi:MAG: hypothetical protein A2W26_11360 [Acidobacteria bacterium RBG_16_64_8]|nr:MAG: hypothetical protein A2W26_11360 [Acidobacteria bacterium RBG_16_64_8]
MRGQPFRAVRFISSVLLLFGVLVFGNPANSAPPPRELVVHTFVDYGPLIERTVSKRMMERFNTKVIWQEELIQNAYAKVLTQQRNPEVSVTIVDPVHYLRGVSAGVWEKIDPKIVTNYATLYPAARQTYPQMLGVPLQANTVGIQYRTDVFLQRGFDPPTGYADLWRPEFKGRVGLTSGASGTGIRMLLIFAKMRGGDENKMEPGFDLVKDLVQKQDVRFFATSSGNFNSVMQRGEIWIGVQFSQGAFRFKSEGAPVNHVYPKEGVSLNVNGVAIVKGAPQPELAQQFVNLLIDPEFQTEMARELWSVPVRPGITLPSLYARTLPLLPDQWKAMVIPNWGLYSQKFSEWSERWLREVERRR